MAAEAGGQMTVASDSFHPWADVASDSKWVKVMGTKAWCVFASSLMVPMGVG